MALRIEKAFGVKMDADADADGVRDCAEAKAGEADLGTAGWLYGMG
jgi:hypothetical protein